MKKILLSGLGGSLFPYLHNALKDEFHLFYLDNNKYLEGIYKGLNFVLAPLVTDPGYKSLVIDLIRKERIDFYIPLIDEELMLAKDEISKETPVQVIAPDTAFIELCLNKHKLMQFLDRNELSHIPSYLGNEFFHQLDYPVFVKPVSGRGSRGIRRIDGDDQLDAYYKLEGYNPEEVLVQPFVEGQEYTVGVTTNDRNQILCIGSKRIISKKGITQMAVTEDNEAINELCFKLVNLMKPNGPINIQLFLTQTGDIKIFEINPRLSTTSILEIEAGVNLIKNYIENKGNHLVKEIRKPEPDVVIHRRWESLFYKL